MKASSKLIQNPLVKHFLPLLLTLIFLQGCDRDNGTNIPNDLDLRQEMRDFVIGISRNAEDIDDDFLFIPQNGIELVTQSGNLEERHLRYLSAIDGNGQEDLFYAHDAGVDTDQYPDTDYLRKFLDISKNSGNQILVTDYCANEEQIDGSYAKNNDAGYVGFATTRRKLDQIPAYPQTPNNENIQDITRLTQVRNFLYLINFANYQSRQQFIEEVTATNYDLLIMDLFFNDGTPFTADEIEQLRRKKEGGRRLVLAYMSIGEAESYRYYWQPEWTSNKPDWMAKENPAWEGNFKVRYWYPEWQQIIYGNEDSYLAKIMNARFDGAYLDIIDAYHYFEKRQ